MPSANVHGVLASVSSVKKGRKQNYFKGKVSDGNSKLWFVGFDSKQQKRYFRVLRCFCLCVCARA